VDVLIVEDDAVLRESLRLLLERAGYTCAEADNGPAVLDLARHQPPRCVLLDLGIPGQDGFKVARLLRADPRTRGLHIHCLTGRSDPATREQADRAGFETVLTKPVDPAQLLGLVAEQVRDTAVEVGGLTMREAEELLDWLEGLGWDERELILEDGGFRVRYRRPSRGGAPAVSQAVPGEP
jgi:two-component system phosphate regulon response regulator PhoB